MTAGPCSGRASGGRTTAAASANPAARAARVLAQLRSVAPEATAEDVERAAEDYTARLERRKGRLADPITAGQLPAVVLAWMGKRKASARTGHGIRPVVEY